MLRAGYDLSSGKYALIIARVVLPSFLVGIAAYATYVLYAGLWFWLGLGQQRVIDDATMQRILFRQIPKAPVSFAVGIVCAAVTFVILCYASAVSNRITR
jgi:hypothetical protein